MKFNPGDTVYIFSDYWRIESFASYPSTIVARLTNVAKPTMSIIVDTETLLRQGEPREKTQKDHTSNA